jgi:hypothetical protein
MVSYETFNKMNKLSKIIEYEINDMLSPDESNKDIKELTDTELTLVKIPDTNNYIFNLYRE